MKTRLNAKYAFAPVSVYAAYVLYMAGLYGAKFILMNLFFSLIPTVMYLSCFYKIKKSGIGIKRIVIYLTVLSLAGLFSLIAFMVGKDVESALISGVAIHTTGAFIFAFVNLKPLMNQESNVLRDKDTGTVYLVRNGNAHRLSEADYQQFKTNGIERVFEFSSGSITGFDIQSPTFPLSSMSSGFDSSEYHAGMAINPSSGMPMVGGISGVDVHGNSWGTNYNEPSSSYDPSRGY